MMAVLHDIGRQYEKLNEKGGISYGKEINDHARNSYRMLLLDLPSNSDIKSKFCKDIELKSYGEKIVI